jgi:hypothetical protein
LCTPRKVRIASNVVITVGMEFQLIAPPSLQSPCPPAA